METPGRGFITFRWLSGSVWLLAAAAVVPVMRAGEDVGAAVRRVEVTARRYAFDPSRIEVRQGETVEIVARSADTEHGLAIKALGVKLVIPKGGAAVSTTFVARQSGRFPIECSEYCGSGHKRMRGELVVTERAR